MTLTPEQQALVDRSKAYPFGTPASSYLFAEGKCWPVRFFNEEDPGKSNIISNGKIMSAAEVFDQQDINIHTLTEPRIPVLASGSNASPTRLNEKFRHTLDKTIIPVIQYSVANLLPVYSAKFASYGSITATLQYVPHSEMEIFVTFLTQQQLQRMHQTEALGDEYDFARIDNTTIRQSKSQPPLQSPAYAYLSRKGVFTLEQQQFTLSPAHNNITGYAFKTQEEMLLTARDLLKAEQPLELFLLQTITDDTFRRQNNELLRAYSLPFLDDTAVKIEHTVASLFR